MSGSCARKRLLRTSVALTAAGSMALAPMPGALAQQVAPIASTAASVVVRIGQSDGFTRVEFAGAAGARAQVRASGRTVRVRIPSTAAPDVARLTVDPPAGVQSVRTRAVAGGHEVEIFLAEGGEFRTGRADGAVYLNLYPPVAAGEAPVRSPVPASGVVPVRATAESGALSLSFDWAGPVGAAVFRRGEAVWVVFDAAARMDLSEGDDLGPATGVRWAAGRDHVVVRIAAPEALPVAASASGSTWTVTVGGAARAASGVALARDDSNGPTSLVARMAGATRTIWLTDPLVGDRFAAVTALGPAKGLGARRQLVGVTLLPSAQGLGVETTTDDLRITPAGDLVRLSRPAGLDLSAPSDQLAVAPEQPNAPQAAIFPALILSEWGQVGDGGFLARRRQLTDAAAVEAGQGDRAPIEARLALARFLVGSQLNYEAIGVIDALVAERPALLGEAEVRGLRGAARASVGRYAEAQADFSGAPLANDPSTAVWQGYIAARQNDWITARRSFAAGARAVERFPADWRTRFAAAHAQAAIETGDLNAARALLAYAFNQQAPAAEQLAARLVQARLFELEGQVDRALAIYRAVSTAPLDGLATPARLAMIKIERGRNAIDDNEAIARLEPLRWRWRGDATELAVIRTLGGIYLSQGRYREALDTLRGAGTRLPDLPEAVELQRDLSNAFRALFLEGRADGLQPVQALALFYDFRDLTPVGADGDDMVRRLSRRLIDVDLLDQAAELLKHQVDNRLDGVAKAQVATDLATVYLMNRQPQQALQALWSSRTTLLPTALNAERRALEARALAELGRYDHALELLGDDRSEAAQEVRAEIYWKQQNWAEAAALYERRLGERWREAGTPLDATEESRLLRAGVGYSLARDAAALARLSQRYGGFIDQARSARALRVALEGLDGGDAAAADFAGLTARADTFAGWVSGMKESLRERAGAATPSA